MASYQNVGTPRFYINVLEWAETNGIVGNIEVYPGLPVNYRTLPVIQKPFAWIKFRFPFPFSQKNFIFLLGHTFKSNNITYYTGAGLNITFDHIINGATPDYDGFSLSTFSRDGETSMIDITSDAWTGHVGSFVAGQYYDMPHSADLKLTLTRDYSGIKTIETKGGASLSNVFYSKPPAWGSLGAWELGSGDPKLSKSGRRVWDLSFSYLQDSDVFPDLSNIGWEGTYDYDYEASGNTLLDDDNFYSQVIHKTNGGQLPFIFQPDGGGGVEGAGNFNPDQFAICKLDMNSFKFEQVANGVYNVKLKIREVW